MFKTEGSHPHLGVGKIGRWIGVCTICRRIIVRSYILHTFIRALTEACPIRVLASRESVRFFHNCLLL